MSIFSIIWQLNTNITWLIYIAWICKCVESSKFKRICSFWYLWHINCQKLSSFVCVVLILKNPKTFALYCAPSFVCLRNPARYCRWRRNKSIYCRLLLAQNSHSHNCEMIRERNLFLSNSRNLLYAVFLKYSWNLWHLEAK